MYYFYLFFIFKKFGLATAISCILTLNLCRMFDTFLAKKTVHFQSLTVRYGTVSKPAMTPSVLLWSQTCLVVPSVVKNRNSRRLVHVAPPVKSRAHSDVYMCGSGVSALIVNHVRAGLVVRGIVSPRW